MRSASCCSAWPTPATLPWPKMPKHPGIRRCSCPSRSLYWLARNRTTAWATVSRMVPTLHNLLMDLWLGCRRPGCEEVEVAALVGLGDVLRVEGAGARPVLGGG